MVLSGEDRRNSKQATHFWIFKTSFDNDKVRDHCRFTKPRLKKHIELNTKLQENAKNEFETEFFKSMSNSFVGNTMENIRNCVDVWLVSNRKRTLKLSAKPNLKTFDNIWWKARDHKKRTKLVFDKPVLLWNEHPWHQQDSDVWFSL